MGISTKVFLFISCLFMPQYLIAMGLRSFVALPVDKGGSVLRFLSDYNFDSNSNVLITSVAYGLSRTQTLLFGLPYRFSTGENNRFNDFSALYRHTLWQNDTAGGTNRFAFLGGFIIPTDSNRDSATQAGFVFTHFKDKHEIDIDALYQKGIGNRNDSGRYDISWQYRLNPKILPDWGIENEIYSELEINGRWKQGNKTSQQITAGLI